MKIIKASVDLKTWCYKTTCTNCASQLEVESFDIRYARNNSKSYYYVCELCGAHQIIKNTDVPAIVQADIKKHRSDPSRSMWD